MARSGVLKHFAQAKYQGYLPRSMALAGGKYIEFTQRTSFTLGRRAVR
jgi:hypothetical protein